MLQELHEVMKQIKELSEAEHDMLKEVQPSVETIKESVKGVAEAVSEEGSKKS